MQNSRRTVKAVASYSRLLRWTPLLFSFLCMSAPTTLTIATVNNGDMIIMQKMAKEFERSHPQIKLDWVVLEENILRQRTTTDIATNGGQFDVATIGTYEVPIWAQRGWLTRLDNQLPASYDLDDIFKPIRDGLSWNGGLYALPFYSESTMTYYRKDLFQQAGLTMPAQPTYQDIERFAKVLNDPAKGIAGVCLRGKPGWGENMAFISMLVHTFGGRWFDEKWNPQIDTPEWHAAITYYVHLLQNYGPPGESSNGFNETLTLFENGKCATWIDATSAADTLYDPAQSRVMNSVGFAASPVAATSRGANWLWSWALAIPVSSKHSAQALQFVEWATSKQYIELVAKEVGWAQVPPGTRKSTYQQAGYRSAAPFADISLKSIMAADPLHPSIKPVPYTGIQYVGIAPFPTIAAQIGQSIAAILVGSTSVDQALRSDQVAAERVMRRAGYIR